MGLSPEITVRFLQVTKRQKVPATFVGRLSQLHDREQNHRGFS
jgi:hypothetical protein